MHASLTAVKLYVLDKLLHLPVTPIKLYMLLLITSQWVGTV